MLFKIKVVKGDTDEDVTHNRVETDQRLGTSTSKNLTTWKCTKRWFGLKLKMI